MTDNGVDISDEIPFNEIKREAETIGWMSNEEVTLRIASLRLLVAKRTRERDEARAAALEEAAQVADSHAEAWLAHTEGALLTAVAMAGAKETARAIRALLDDVPGRKT